MEVFFFFFCSQTNVYKQAVFADVDVVRFFICKHIPELTPDFNPVHLDSQGYVLALQSFSSPKFSYFYKDFQNQHTDSLLQTENKKTKTKKRKRYNEYITPMTLFSVFIFVFFFFNR